MPKLPTGVMLGDVTGIGPEIAARALASRVVRDKANFVMFGDARVLDLGIRDAGVTTSSGRAKPIRARWKQRLRWLHSLRRAA